MVLRKIASFIRDSQFYSIMVDKCVDASNREQLVLCFRWVDTNLDVHEDFFGLYQVPNITSDALQAAIKDTLLRMNLSLARCRGQCYDGASNMAGAAEWCSQSNARLRKPSSNFPLLWSQFKSCRL